MLITAHYYLGKLPAFNTMNLVCSPCRGTPTLYFAILSWKSDKTKEELDLNPHLTSVICPGPSSSLPRVSQKSRKNETFLQWANCQGILVIWLMPGNCQEFYHNNLIFAENPRCLLYFFKLNFFLTSYIPIDLGLYSYLSFSKYIIFNVIIISYNILSTLITL